MLGRGLPDHVHRGESRQPGPARGQPLTSLANLAAFPQSLAAPALIALLLPLVILAIWMLRHRGRRYSVASRVAVTAGAVVSLSLGAGIVAATLTVIEAGLDAALPETQEQAVDLAASAERVWRGPPADPSQLTPLLAVSRAARPHYIWVAIVRLDCSAGCIVATAGAPEAVQADRLARIVVERPNRGSVSSLRIGGHLTVAARAAIRTADGRPHAVAIVAANIDAVSERARLSAWRMVIAEIVLAIVSWLAIRRLLAVTVADRLNQLTARLGEQNLDSAGPERLAGDELRALSDQVDASVRRSTELESQLQQAQRIEAIGRLSGGIAHDFNNLLTVIRANTSLLSSERVSDELEAIDAAAQRGATLVRKLLAFGRREPLNLKPEPIGPLLHEVMAVVRRVLPASIELSVRCEVPEVGIEVDRAAFEQIVLNLATNARDAMPNGGRFEVDVDVGPLPPAAATHLGVAGDRSHVAVRFRDSGTGMSSETLNRAFEPFFTTKPPEEGSGLGLATVHGLARRQQGWVDISSRPGKGTTATVYFAAVVLGSTPVDTPAAPSRDRSRSGPRQLLLVEDEEGVRRTTARALERFGYGVDLAANGREALDMIVAGERYDLVVSDVMMPVMGGLDLTRAIRATGIMTPVLLVSGYSIDDVAGFCRRCPNVGVLGKPWSPNQLSDAIEGLIEAVAPAGWQPR